MYNNTYSISSESFIKKAKSLVLRDNVGLDIYDENIFVIWYCKQLQNHKALLGTIRDNHYYEITYDGDKGKFYFDKYNKLENKVFNLNLGEITTTERNL